MENLDDKMAQITGKERVEEKIDKLENKIYEHSFAYDLLTEFKALNKRQFIAIVMLILLWFATIVTFVGVAMWFFDTYELTSYTESYEYSQDGEGFNNLNTGSQGDVTYGAETDNQSSQQENQQEVK